MDFTGKRIWPVVSECQLHLLIGCLEPFALQSCLNPGLNSNVYVCIVFQVTMPQSNIIIITNPASDLHMRRNRVIVHPIQGEYSRDKLMLQRIRSYIVRAHCI